MLIVKLTSKIPALVYSITGFCIVEVAGVPPSKSHSQDSIFPEDWRYSTLDGPENGVAVAGYDVSIASYGNRVAASWLSASGLRLPNPDEVSFILIDEDESPTRVATQAHGTPGTPLLIDAKGLCLDVKRDSVLLALIARLQK